VGSFRALLDEMCSREPVEYAPTGTKSEQNLTLTGYVGLKQL